MKLTQAMNLQPKANVYSQSLLPHNMVQLTATRVRSAGVVTIVLALALVFAGRLNAQTFTAVTFPGAAQTEAHGINAFGEIVGQWTDSGGMTHGFLDKQGVFTSFDVPGSVATYPYGINNAGDIVGTFDTSTTRGSGFLDKSGVFTTLPAPGFDINNMGELIAAGSNGFIDDNGVTLIPITFPGAFANTTTSWGIDDNAEVVGWYEPNGSTDLDGFIYSFGTYTAINVPGSHTTECWGINNYGEIVGQAIGLSDSQLHGFLDNRGTFTQLDFPGFSHTIAHHINDFGAIVGAFWQAFQVTNGFIFSPAARNPVPRIYLPSVPGAVGPGSGGFTLTVNGAEFVSGAVVKWNGSPLPTTFVNSHKLTATVSSSDVAGASTAALTVVNPAPGGGTSNTRFFQVTSPVTTPTFTLSTVTAGSSPQRTIAADFNHDGIMDMAAVDGPNNEIIVMLGNGDGTFDSPVPYPAQSNPSGLIAADFNGDGNLDIVSANYNNNTIFVLLGNGDGTFHAPIDFGTSTGGGPWDLAVGDFNGDGRLDLAVVNNTGNSISVFLGNGDGSFQARRDVPTNSNPGQMTVGDFNGDGILDMAVANFGGFTGNTVSVFLGNGNGTFKPKVDYATNLAPLSVVTADFNGDGKLDLAVADSCGSSSPCGRPGLVSILLGNGDGTFQTHVDYAAGSFPYTIVAGDFNGDGKLDVAVSDLDSAQVTILSGPGDGTFPNSTATAAGASAVGLVAADFNNDGEMDLAVGTGSGISILLQNVTQASIASLSLSPTSVLGGAGSTGTVTLTNAAPAGGATINFTSSNVSAVPTPASITIPAGATSGTFPVSSSPVAADVTVTISATSGSSTKTANLTVKAPTLVAFMLSPGSQVGGQTVAANATLSGTAPSGGITVQLSSNNPSVASTSNITVPGGSLTGTSTITTQPVANNTAVKITAQLGAIAKTNTLTVKAAGLSAAKLSPTSVYGSVTSTLTVTLTGVAPAGGATITLTSSNSSIASLPSQVTVSGGATSAVVTVQTLPVSSNTVVTISAVYLGVTKSANLTVKAPILASITVSPASVTGGSPSTATVTLNDPAPAGGVLITLTSSKTTVATVPPNATVAAGATTATATVTTFPRLTSTTVQISAHYGTATKSKTLTVH